MIAALVVLGSIPAVASSLAGGGVIVGPGSVLVGLAAAVWSFFKAGEKLAGKVPLGVLATFAAAFLIYGLLLTAYATAAFVHREYFGLVFLAWLVGLGLLSYLFGWFANVNYISMHRFYRDRLMETFLPNRQNALDNVTDAATDADPVRLSKVNNASDGRGPYHIVNTNVLLVDSKRRRWRIRGGDNFILSPLYCGSNATGWCDTKDFLGNGMTLATAMAISGAAANPNTGVGGVGLTCNPLVSILMALLNLRLGYWAHHPLSPPTWGRRPNHFRPGSYEVGSLINVGGMREDRSFVQLSDGGHFENLALYELVRRRLRLIIVCDGGADGEFKFADLQTALRRIEADFGATVTFEDDQKPAILVPSFDAGYPMGTKQADRGYIVGDIAYADNTWGKLILLKTTMVEGASTEVRGYKGAHPDFPDQTTADQFFDEEQFEAYRELGHCIGEQMGHGTGPVAVYRDHQSRRRRSCADALTLRDRRGPSCLGILVLASSRDHSLGPRRLAVAAGRYDRGDLSWPQQEATDATLKSVVCTSCDGFCPLSTKVKDGRVVKVTTREHPFFKDVICMKGAYAPKSFAHPDRILHPLKRTGERGDGSWAQVSWDEAMDDIADRLGRVVDRHGPEAFAVAASYANFGLDNGLTRRFMNLLGSPNFTSGVAYCMGNTAAVNRMVYGWYPRGDILNSKCVVLFGHDPRRHSWTLEYKSIRVAQAGGAKLIVLDPRKSGNADAADLWLPLRAGTDAAMMLGWLNVILEEGLYDKDFVRDWTVGFEQFAERISEYPLDRVADITGVDAGLIAKAARMYATVDASGYPVVTDHRSAGVEHVRHPAAMRVAGADRQSRRQRR